MAWELPHGEATALRPCTEVAQEPPHKYLQSGNDKDKANALEYFILNVENFPISPNCYDSLGEAYEVLGDTKKAIENYGKSLELNPDNENARMKIKKLSKSE